MDRPTRDPRPSTPAHPFVGRDAELARLRTAWDRALPGERQIVFLSGEPGIGKTRLATEFAEEVCRSRAVVLRGRCDEDPVAPYEPFVHLLGQLADAEARGASAGVRPLSLADLVADQLGAAAPVSGMTGPSTSRHILFEGVRTLLRDAARREPLLILLDDLHWADADTLRLVRYLGRGAWGAPALLLCNFRSTEPASAVSALHAVIAELHSDAAVESIELGSLGLAHVQLVAALALGRNVDEREASGLHEASGGNPFFLRELLASAPAPAEGGSISRIPVAAREVIACRLARLSPDARELLAMASVLGPQVEPDLLAELWDGDPQRLIAALEEAVVAGLLSEDGSRYRFTHMLVEQSIYVAVPLPRRRELHLRAARALAARHPGPHGSSALIATHFRKAGDVSAAAESLPHALAAGEESLAVLALEDAVGWWEWSDELMESLGTDHRTRARLYERMASVLDSGREVTRAVAYLERALALYQAIGDAGAIALARSRLGRAHSIGNHRNTDLVTARAFFAAAAPALAGNADQSRLAVLETSWAALGVSSFRIDDMRHAGAAIRLAPPGRRRAVAETNRVAAGALLIHRGHTEEGLKVLLLAVQEARASGDVVRSAESALVAATMAQRFCDPRVAIEVLRPELESWPAPAAAAPFGMAARTVSALADAGDLSPLPPLLREHTARDEDRIEVLVERIAWAFYQGEWSGPLWEEAEVAARSAAAHEDRCSYQNLGHWLVRAYWARSLPSRAASYLEVELAAARQGGSIGMEFVARAELAALAAESRSFQAAETHLARCRAILAAGARSRGLEAKLLLVEALAAGDAGDPAVMAERFESAAAVARAYNTPWLEARIFENWARVLATGRLRQQAATKRREAAALYRRIGAGEPWLQRLFAPGGRAPAVPRDNLPAALTVREAEVLRMLAGGCSSRAIASELVLSVRTVERHIANIYLKTAAHGRAQITAYAISHGLDSGRPAPSGPPA